jgi:hypothetical protein
MADAVELSPVASEARHGRVFELAAGLLTVLLAVVTVWTVPRPTGDLYVGLAAGRDIVDGKLNALDDWSFRTKGRVWVNQNWGTHLLYYLFYRATGGQDGQRTDDEGTGEIGLLVLKILLLGVGATFLALACRQRGVGWPIALLVTGGTMAAGRSFIDLRPNLTTLMFVPVMLFLLYRTRGRPRRYWLVMPIFGLVWANLHGGFFFGLLVMGLWALCMVVPELVAAALRKPVKAPVRGKARRAKGKRAGGQERAEPPAEAAPVGVGAVLRRDWPFLAATAGAIVLAGIVTPFGIHNLFRSDTTHGFTWMWNLTHPLIVLISGESEAWQSVIEWHSIFTASTRTFGTSWEFFTVVGLFCLLVSIRIAAKLRKREPLTLRDVVLLVGILVLAFAVILRSWRVWEKFSEGALKDAPGAAEPRGGWLTAMICYWLIGLLGVAVGLAVVNQMVSPNRRFSRPTARQVGMIVFDVFMAALGVKMAFGARRFIPLSLILLAPLVAMQLQWLLRSVGRGWPTVLAAFAVMIPVGFQTRRNAMSYLPYSPLVRDRSMLKNMIVYRMFPPGPRDFIKDNHPRGRVFNEWRWEGYLHWYRPELELFLGGRAQQAYDVETYKLQQRILRGVEDPGCLEVMGVQWIVVPLNRSYSVLLQRTVYSPTRPWVPVFCDGENVVLANPRTRDGRQMIARCQAGQLTYRDPGVAALSRGYSLVAQVAGGSAGVGLPAEARRALRNRLARGALAALKESHRHRPITLAYRAMTDVYKHLLVEPGREIAYLKAEDERLAKMDYHRLGGAEILRCRYEVLVLITRLYEAVLRNQNLPQVSADAARRELARTRAEAGELAQEMELLIAQWR